MNCKDDAIRLAAEATPDHPGVLPALEGCRRLWQKAAGGQSLLEVMVLVGLVLAEIAHALGLSDQERRAVLGVELAGAIAHFAKTRVQLKY